MRDPIQNERITCARADRLGEAVANVLWKLREFGPCEVTGTYANRLLRIHARACNAHVRALEATRRPSL